MWRNLILTAGLFACLIPAGTFAQEYRKTVTVEVYLPEGARLFIEGQETRSKGPMRRFVSPPLPPGKYTDTIKAIIPGPNGPRTVTRWIAVRPGDFESIDLSKRPTIVTIYLLPRLHAKSLPQLRKLPPGARVISVAHRMADVKPDEQIVVDTELGEFDVYL